MKKSFKDVARNIVSAVAIFSILLQPVAVTAQTITIDATAPRANQPGLSTSGGNRPVINIVTPNAGVSHNRFGSLSSSSGLIFNNSNTAGTSQTGGTVQGNAALATSGSAKVILNEVRGATGTTLAGSNEVFGGKADLIIANPNGVTCNGCVFVNTGSTVLSTGVPTVAGDTVTLRAQKGSVTIGRGGARGGDAIVLQGRHVVVDGAVTANDLVEAIGGGSTYDAKTGQSAALATGERRVTNYGVDATEFGAMTAGTIRVQTHEPNMDNRLKGHLKSSAADVILKNGGGSTEVNKITSARDVKISSAKDVLHYSGQISAQRDIIIDNTAGVMTRDVSSMASGRNMLIDADDYVVTSGELTAVGNLTLRATNKALNLGLIVSGAALTVVAGEVSNIRPDIERDTTFMANPALAANPVYYRALLASTIGHHQRAGQVGAGGVMAANTLTVTSTTGDLRNYGMMLATGDATISAKQTFWQRALSSTNRAGLVPTDRTAQDRSTITGLLGAGHAGNLYDSLRAPLVSGSVIYTGAQVQAVGSLAVTAGYHLYNYGGELQSGGKLDLSTTSYDIYLNSHGRLSVNDSYTGDVTLIAARNFSADNTVLRSFTGKLWLQSAGGFALGQSSADGSLYKDLVVKALGANWTNTFSNITAGTGFVHLETGYALNNPFAIKTAGSVTLKSRYTTVYNTGQIQSLGAKVHLIADRQHIESRANLIGHTGVEVTAGTSFLLTGARIDTTGDVIIKAGQYAGGNIHLTHATAGQMNGFVRSQGAGRTITLETPRGSILVLNSGLTVNGAIDLSASGEIRFQRSLVQGQSVLADSDGHFVMQYASTGRATVGDFRVATRSNYYQHQTAISAGRDFIVSNAGNMEIYDAPITAGRNININAQRGWIVAQRNWATSSPFEATTGSITLRARDNIHLYQAAYSAAAGFNIADASTVYIYDSAITAGSIDINAQRGSIVAQKYWATSSPFEATTGAITLRARDNIHLYQAAYTAAGAFNIADASNVYIYDSPITAASINISATRGSIYNRQNWATPSHQTARSGSITWSAKYDIDNYRGRLTAANGDFTISTARNIVFHDAVTTAKSVDIFAETGSFTHTLNWTAPSVMTATAGDIRIRALYDVHHYRSTFTAAGNFSIADARNIYFYDAATKARNVAINAERGSFTHMMHWATGSVTTATAGSVSINALYDVHHNRSRISASGDVRIDDARTVNFQDSDTTGRNIVINANRGAFYHAMTWARGASTVATGNLTIRAAGDVSNYRSTMSADADLNILRSNNTYLYNSKTVADGNLAITATGTIVNRVYWSATPAVLNGNSVALTAGGQIYNYRSDIYSNTTIDAVSTASNIYNAGGLMRAKGDISLDGKTGIYNYFDVREGDIASTGGSVLMDGQGHRVDVRNARINAAVTLSMAGLYEPIYDAAAQAKMGYRNLNVQVRGGGFTNPFTVDALGYVQFVARDTLTNDKTVRADQFIRMVSSTRNVNTTGALTSDQSYVTVQGQTDVATRQINAKTDVLVQAVTGSATNVGTYVSGGKTTVKARLDLGKDWFGGIYADDAILVEAGRNLYLNGATIRGKAQLDIISGLSEAGSITTNTRLAFATAPGSNTRQSRLESTGGGTISLRSFNGGHKFLDGLYVRTDGAFDLRGGYRAYFDPMTVGTATVNADILTGSIYMAQVGVFSTNARIQAMSNLVLVSSGNGIDLSGGMLQAHNIRLQNNDANQRILVEGMTLVNAGDQLLIDDAGASRIQANRILAKRFDFADTPTVALVGEIDVRETPDVVLTAYRNLIIGGASNARDFNLTATRGQLQIAGSLIATRNVVLTGQTGVLVRNLVAANLTINANAGDIAFLGSTAANAAAVDSGQNAFATHMASLIGASDVDPDTGDTITVTELQAGLRSQARSLVHTTDALDLNSNRSIFLRAGAVVSSAGDISLSAANSIRIESLFDAATRIQHRAGLVAGGNLTLAAQGTFTTETGYATGIITPTVAALSDHAASVYGAAGSVYNAGSISAKDDLLITAANHIGNFATRSTYVQTAVHNCGYNACGRDAYVFSPGEMMAGHGIIMSAEGDIINEASHVAAAGAIIADAGRDIINDIQSDHFLSYYYQKTKRFLGIKTGETVDMRYSAVMQSGVFQTQYGDIFLTAGRDFDSSGSHVSAGANVSLQAGRDVMLEAWSVELHNYYKNSGFSGFLTYSSNKTRYNNFETSLAQIEGFDVAIQAGRDVMATGVVLMALNDLSISAENNQNYDAKQNLRYLEESGWSFGLTSNRFKITQAVLTNANTNPVRAYIDDNPMLGAVYQLATAEDGWGTVNGALALLFAGSQTLADAARAERGTVLHGSALARSFIPSDILDAQALSNLSCADFRGNFAHCVADALGLGFRFSAWKSRSEWTESLVTRLGSGRDTTLIAGQDLVLAGGTVVSAGRDLTMIAGRDFLASAVADNRTDVSNRWGFSVGLGGGGVTIGANASGSAAAQTMYTNAIMTALDTITLATGRDAAFLGAVMQARPVVTGAVYAENATAGSAPITPEVIAETGGNIYMDIGRDLTIASLQNTSNSRSWGFNASVTFGPSGGITGFQLGGTYGRGNAQYVQAPTWIEAERVLDIYVDRATYLMGAVLASRNDGLTLDTAEFIFDHANNSHQNVNVSVGVSAGEGPGGTWSFDGNAGFALTAQTGLTRATVHGGEVTVRNRTTINWADLNQDLERVDIITGRKNINLQLPGLNLKKLAENLEVAGNYIRASVTDIPDTIRAQGEQAVDLYRQAIIEGMSGAELRAYAGSSDFAELLARRQSWAEVAANPDATPQEVARIAMLIADGEQIYFDETRNQFMISRECSSGETVCGVPLDQLEDLTRADVQAFIDRSIQEIATFVAEQSYAGDDRAQARFDDIMRCAMSWALIGGDGAVTFLNATIANPLAQSGHRANDVVLMRALSNYRAENPNGVVDIARPPTELAHYVVEATLAQIAYMRANEGTYTYSALGVGYTELFENLLAYGFSVQDVANVAGPDGEARAVFVASIAIQYGRDEQPLADAVLTTTEIIETAIFLRQAARGIAAIFARGSGTVLSANLTDMITEIGARRNSIVPNSDLVSRILGRIGLYPRVIDPRTGRAIMFPSGIQGVVPPNARVVWNNQTRADYIAEYRRRGYPEPRGGWANYDIHHIQPREFGGSNSFWNLVPVERGTHQSQFNTFWREFTDL